MIANQIQFKQMSFFNTLSTLSERRINWLLGTWAFAFRLFIYPLINPALFDCLYSSSFSRPANPPQVVVSLLLIQQMFGKTDDEMHEWMMGGDLALLFATNTLGLPSNVIYSHDKQLTRFRERLKVYASEHDGKSPMDECLQNVSFGMWAMMGISLKNVRMDSTQIAANMAKMSRTSLIYHANLRMIKSILTGNADRKDVVVKANLGHYLEENDVNVVLYHSHISAEEKQTKLAKEADAILSMCTTAELETAEGQLYQRILNEQTIVENGVRRFVTKEDGTLKASFVQSPIDPDATCRTKAGKTYIGYVLNFAEAVGEYGSQIVSWDLEQNITQDPIMAKTFLDEAEAIVNGINEYCKLLGIEQPGNMKECQETIQQKMASVRAALLDAYHSGKHITRAFEKDPLYDGSNNNEDEEDSAYDGYQMSLEDLLMDKDVPVWTSEAIYGEKEDVSHSDDSENAPNESNESLKAADESNNDKSTDDEEAVKTMPLFEAVTEGTTEEKATDASSDDNPNTETIDTPQNSLVGENEKEASSGKDDANHRLILVDGRCQIDGIDVDEYIAKHDFANLPDEIRRQALQYKLRQKQTFQLEEIGDGNIISVDGAYSEEELQKMAAEAGFTILPTDLLGIKSNPVLGLYSFDSEKTTVMGCPMNKQIVEQQFNNKTGQIVLKMAADACKNCPFQKDCKAEWQSRKETWRVIVHPNAYSRVHTAAFLGEERYKCVGRFRNGVETIPSFLHNVLDIDNMPIGKAAKEAAMGFKVLAANIRKFILYCRGTSVIRDNPLISRSFAQ